MKTLIYKGKGPWALPLPAPSLGGLESPPAGQPCLPGDESNSVHFVPPQRWMRKGDPIGTDMGWGSAAGSHICTWFQGALSSHHHPKTCQGLSLACGPPQECEPESAPRPASWVAFGQAASFLGQGACTGLPRRICVSSTGLRACRPEPQALGGAPGGPPWGRLDAHGCAPAGTKLQCPGASPSPAGGAQACLLLSRGAGAGQALNVPEPRVPHLLRRKASPSQRREHSCRKSTY